MSSGDTRSRKRDAGTIQVQVAGQPEAKRAKRLRVSWACAECRRKKERCDGVQPVCGSCKSQDRDCSYVQRPKKRGLTTGYVRGLETLLGLIFHSVEGCEHSIVAILKGESSIASPSGREDQPASTVNALVDAWRNSPPWKELERILSTVESGEDEEITARDLHDRIDQALSKALSIKERTAASSVLSERSPADSQAGIIDYDMAPDLGGSPAGQRDGDTSTTKTGDIEALKRDSLGPSNLLRDWPELLDVYFANTNSWIPIVLKNDAFRTAYTLSTDFDSSKAKQLPPGDQTCLISMLAYARYIQCITAGKDGFRKDLQDHFADLFTQASQLLSDYDSRREIGHIQAMLIFTLLHYAQGNLSLAWSFVGRAVYHAVELGLLNSDITQSSPLNLRSKRVMLSCFVLETLLSARLNRRPYLRMSDVQSVGLLDADGIEEWEPFRPAALSSFSMACNGARLPQQPARILSTFNLLVQASTIMNDNLQGHISDADKEIPRGHLDILHLLQSQNHLNSLFPRPEAHEASPQAVNLMLATAACLLQLMPLGADAGYGNFSCPSSPQANWILASVAQGVNQQSTVMLPPVSDVYLDIIESRNRNTNSAFSHEALDFNKFVREIRMRYNETWRSNDSSREATTVNLNHAEPIAVPISRARVLGKVPSNQLRPRDQDPTMDTTNTAANEVSIYTTRTPRAFVPLQSEGFARSRRVPPKDAPYPGDSRSHVPNSLDMTGSRDLFSSLVSLETDERSRSLASFLTGTDSRPVLSQEFLENLGVLGDISMDTVEFQNLFTG